MNKEEIQDILELSKNDKNLHHKKGYDGLLFITLSMIQFSKLKIYIKSLEQQNKKYKEVIDKTIEYIKRFDIEHLHECMEHNLAEVLEDLDKILKGE